MNGPCKNCEKKGCGSYHDECERYQKWRNEIKRQKQSPGQRDFIKTGTFKSRTHGAFKCHKK